MEIPTPKIERDEAEKGIPTAPNNHWYRDILILFVGSLIGTFITITATTGVEYIRNRFFLAPSIARDLLLEIGTNQQRVNKQIEPTKAALNDVNNNVYNIYAPPEQNAFMDLYHTNLPSINLLDDNVKNDIVIYYENLINLNYVEGYASFALSQYKASPQKNTQSDAQEVLRRLIKDYQDISMLGDSIQKEIINIYH